MTTLSQALSMQSRKALLGGLTLFVLLLPTCALSAEREGSVFFFSVEDLRQVLTHPTLPSLWHLSPSVAWWEQPKAAEQDGPLERNVRWGHGLGIDGYTRPGTRPLWGY